MKNIVLIGFMGTGKTEVGTRLARRLGWRFEDTDEHIKRRAGRTIGEIFRLDGEPRFRKLEKDVIRELSDTQRSVIATGGGAVIDPSSWRLLRGMGTLIALEARPETILSRAGGTDRPLLSRENQLGRIKALLKERAQYYNRCDHRIETSNKNPEQVTAMIMDIVAPAEPIRVDLEGRGYSILIERGLLSRVGREAAGLGLKGKMAIVTNKKVGRFYGSTVRKSLEHSGFETATIMLPDGERFKTLRSVSKIYDHLLMKSFERGSTLLALGGGVIGDLAGFAAATYLRGVGFIQVPTTLAAQVDASIGGKTGVDHPRGKNLIGAFYQPKAVLIDPDVLSTLKTREFVSGLAEVVKYGVIRDEAFFAYLEDNIEKVLKKEPAAVGHAVRRSCAVKADVVARDEREGGLRRILNYGHTLGHAIETASGYRKYLHGEAVSLGMVFAARLALQLGLCTEETARRQTRLLTRAGLPVKLPNLNAGAILKIMGLDKKVSEGRIHFVLAERIGKVVVKPVSRPEIIRALKGGFTAE